MLEVTVNYRQTCQTSSVYNLVLCPKIHQEHDFLYLDAKQLLITQLIHKSSF